MPIYDFRCGTCGPFTVMRRIAEYNTACACPNCGAAAQRMLSAPALSFIPSTSRSERQIDARAVRASQHHHGPGCGCGPSTHSSTVATGSSLFPSSTKNL
ncbi:MAG TPA: zinc ribbon domain-containing protein [Trinickia sp.]|uniref:FmdB family zinc ribbon protein n=1 Tax=Trinickia sp. TaxID=2571163 RepID=UPI002C06FAD7|nr:zinc ribbon domain-containing protein [Trinickia sp.]HTI16629.1 zinc ribbon domain-containing protein [Trinickia sp.]